MLGFPLICTTFYKPGCFVHARFLWGFPGGRITAWVFQGPRWVIWGSRARALCETAAFPSCATLIPPWQRGRHLLSVAEVLEGMKINKAWQLCSRVMTCSPSCHFQLHSSLSGLHVIEVSRPPEIRQRALQLPAGLAMGPAGPSPLTPG